jgi:GWxTD domain-containing protein
MKSIKYASFIFIVLISACYSGNNVSEPDYTYLYNPEQRLIKPDLKIYHHAADSSTLYFRMKSDDILYSKMMGDDSLTTRLLVKYKVFDYEKKELLLDSATIGLIDLGQNERTEFLQAKVVVYMPIGKLYRLRIYFRDEYKDLNTVYEQLYDKRLNGNQEFYLLKQSGKIIYNAVATEQKEVTIYKSPLIKCTKFELDSANHEFKMTPPPFVTDAGQQQINFSFRSNLSFEDSINIDHIGRLNRLIPIDSQLLRFHFFFFQAGYPYITELDQMVEPIRYISTTAEYKRIKNALNLKKEIDQFWLKLGKDENTAKALIREYYRRVELANAYFSSYREGWKTDRGIIFIVYGQPNTIYKDLNSESWIYGEENNILSVKFIFKKIRSEESDNIYILRRNEDYKSNWYRAVDDWRQGRINS